MKHKAEHILALAVSLLLLGGVSWALGCALMQPVGAASSTHYVAPHGDCHGAMPCYAALQAAVDAAAPGDEIRVAQGIYTDVRAVTYDLGGWSQTVTQTLFISKSLTVRGGYTVTDWAVSQPLSHPTVINPQGRGRGILITIPTFQSSITVTVEGFSITQGYALLDGSGLYAYGANVTISGCRFYSNTGNSIGSGLYLAGTTATLIGNIVADSRGAGYGHGVVVDAGYPAQLVGNRILRNGNGLLIWNNRATLINNIIAANAGDGLSVIGGTVHGWHTTVADNGRTGIKVINSGQVSGSLTLTNTIIAGPGVGVQVGGSPLDASVARLTATLWHNLTDTQVTEGGRIIQTADFEGDPAFVGDGDYHLTAASPARNRGWPSDVHQDIDGELRDPLPDLGADEYLDPDSIRSVYLPLVTRGQ